MDERTLKRFAFSLPLFAKLFITGSIKKYVVERGFPVDAIIADVHYDGFRGVIWILVHSHEYQTVPKGELPPTEDVVCTTA